MGQAYYYYASHNVETHYCRNHINDELKCGRCGEVFNDFTLFTKHREQEVFFLRRENSINKEDANRVRRTNDVGGSELTSDPVRASLKGQPQPLPWLQIIFSLLQPDFFFTLEHGCGAGVCNHVLKDFQLIVCKLRWRKSKQVKMQ